jgi:tol-pal system protein YbgF
MNNGLFKSLPIALSGLLVMSASFADTWSSVGGMKQSPTQQAAAPKAPGLSAGAAQILFSDIDLLKQELQKLQNVVEEQSHELNKLKTEQKERYLDLDRRLSQAVKSDQSTGQPSKDRAKELYTVAFELMKDKKLEEAANGFNSFLQEYPKNPLVVNGYYWLGQIYYNQGKLDDARKAFTIVVNQFPNHQKTADSMYKLGVVLHRLGDLAQGKRYLSLVVKQFSDSATARFARKYLKENYTN